MLQRHEIEEEIDVKLVNCIAAMITPAGMLQENSLTADFAKVV